MTPGSLFVILANVFVVIALVSAIRWARGHAASERIFRLAYHAMTLCLGVATVLLLVAILHHDFRFDYVWRYTSRDLPLLYLISAFWGGQSGTYLLWAFGAALIGYPLFRKRAWEPATVMAFYTVTIGFLTVLMLDPGGNPFRLIPGGQVPPDGNGLNPLLQDFWMAFHPPMIFLGYAAMTVPAALAMTAVFRREETRWLGPGLRWSLAGFITLGIGIIMGAFWAYKTLGWGGYWGWDPVENASLIPWIVVTALVHGILVQNATGSLRRTNLALALGGYLLVMYATFLTRSGVLADFSVHSFPEGTIYRFLVTILVIILAGSVFAMLRRKGPEGASIPMKLSWPAVLSAVIVLLGVSATFVLIGTSWPILSSAFTKPTVPGVPFYNRVNVPLYLVLLALLSFAPFLGWSAAPVRTWARRLVIPVAAAAAATALAIWTGGRGVVFLVLYFLAWTALVSNVVRLVQVARIRALNTGAALAHVGFAMMFVGIIASSVWQHDREVTLPLGQPVEVQGMFLTYRGHVRGSEPKDRWRLAVLRPGRAEVPTELTMYKLPGQPNQDSVFRKPAIIREATRDLYFAALGLRMEEQGAGGHLDLHRGQPVPYGKGTVTFLRFEAGPAKEGHPMSFFGVVEVAADGGKETLSLPLSMADGELRGTPVKAKLLGTTLTLRRMNVEAAMIQVDAGSGGAPPAESLVIMAATKPMMTVLWAGTFLLVAGCLVALARRWVDARVAARAPARAGVTVTVGGIGGTAAVRPRASRSR